MASAPEFAFHRLEVDTTNQVAVVQPGVTLLELDAATAGTGLRYMVHPGEVDPLVTRAAEAVLAEWVGADRANERWFPHQFMYKILSSGVLKKALAFVDEIVRSPQFLNKRNPDPRERTVATKER